MKTKNVLVYQLKNNYYNICTNFADYDSLFEILVLSLDKHFGVIQNVEFPVTTGHLLR